MKRWVWVLVVILRYHMGVQRPEMAIKDYWDGMGWDRTRLGYTTCQMLKVTPSESNT